VLDAVTGAHRGRRDQAPGTATVDFKGSHLTDSICC